MLQHEIVLHPMNSTGPTYIRPRQQVVTCPPSMARKSRLIHLMFTHSMT